MSSPSKRMAPLVGPSCNRISFEVVVLPQPDSPITPRVSPGETAKSMPSTALTQPIWRRGNSATVTGKCLVSPSTSNSGGDIETLCGLPVLRLGAPAPGPPFAADPDFAGLLDAAARHCLGTAWMEGAARRQGGKLGRMAGA